MIDPATFWHWFEVHTGTVNESGPYYGFWSGFGSDLGEVTLLAAVIAGARHLNCHHQRCWRVRTHPVLNPDGTPTPYKACRKHHPQIDNTRPITTERMGTWHERHPKPTTTTRARGASKP